MARQPRNYQVLRDEHARALDALNQHIQPPDGPDRGSGAEPPTSEPSVEHAIDQQAETEPTRPEQVHRTSPGWTDRGDMASQQAAAVTYNNWIVLNDDKLELGAVDIAPANIEQSATNELDQYIDGQDRGDSSGQEVAENALTQHIDRQGRAGQEINQEFQDAARETLDHHIDTQPPGSGVDRELPPPGPEIDI